MCTGPIIGCQATRVEYRFDHGPTTIERRIHEKDVFIPCPFLGSTFPVWIINGVHYEIFHVPAEYIPSPYGLLIPSLRDKHLNGTTFKCIVSADNNIGYVESTTGMLIIHAE